MAESRRTFFIGVCAPPLIQKSAWTAHARTSFVGARVPRRVGVLPAARRCRPRHVVVAVVAGGGNQDDSDGNSGDGADGDADDAEQSSAALDERVTRVNDLRERLERIDFGDEEEPEQQRGRRYIERETQLLWLTKKFPSEIAEDCGRYLDNPMRQVVAGALSILFGFFSATSASTIIGSVADWDPLAAAVLLVWTETFTKWYYSTGKKTLLLRLINAFKVGIIYGMALDAFKLST